MKPLPDRKPRILMMEDNPGDVGLLKIALRSANVDCDLFVIADGEEALSHVRHLAEGSAPRPDLVVLDVNIPKQDGVVILQAIRSNDALKDLPVMTLTSSSSPRELARLHNLGIIRHVTKPVDLAAFMQVGTVVKEILASVKQG